MGTVSLEVQEKVATLTLDSPAVRNGLSPDMARELMGLCEELDADLGIGAAVVRGAHGTFCSGADTRTWTDGSDLASDEVYRDISATYDSLMRIGSLKVPTIAAVQGAAVGAGLNLMMATDLRIVAKDARLLSGFLKIGVHPGGGYFSLSGRLAGREATAAMGLFDETIDGRRAVELGLAWEALDAADVDARAHELAVTAASDPALAREAVRSFRTELGAPALPWAAAVEFERATQMWSLRRRPGGEVVG